MSIVLGIIAGVTACSFWVFSVSLAFQFMVRRVLPISGGEWPIWRNALYWALAMPLIAGGLAGIIASIGLGIFIGGGFK